MSTTITECLLASTQATPSSVNRADRSLTVVFYSGTAIQRVDPWSGDVYDLTLDPAGADLSRLNSGAAPVLDSHSRVPVASQVGVVKAARETRGQFFADLKFSSRPEVEGLWNDLAEGVVRCVSMGVELLEYRDEMDDRDRLVRRIATKWRPFEISVVTVPADPGAVSLSHESGQSMKTYTSPTQGAGTETAAAPNELKTLLSHMNLGAEFDSAILATPGITLKEAKCRAADVICSRDTTPDTQHGSTAATGAFVLRSGEETAHQGMIDALYSRGTGKAPSDNGRRFHGMRLVEMARECLSYRGGPRIVAGGESKVVELALHTTSDFPNLLSGYAGKVLMESYQAATGALKTVSRRSTASDFKLKRLIRRGEFPDLKLVAEHAEYTHGTIGESAESYRLDTYGRIFGITRQAIINDDLSAFTTLGQAIGQAVANFEDNFLIDILTSNSGNGPTMGDTYALFDAAHHFNKSGSGAAIGDTTLDAARIAMRTQKGVDGVTIVDAQPRYLIVPVTKQTAAEKYLASLYPAQASNVNPFSGKLELLTDPRLDAKSTTRWYMFADPDVVPSLEYSYLSGAEGPQTETRVGFEVDGLEVKVRVDFGAAAIDWRGAYCNAGA
ncbi:prohead protease/major capsid protein fusion protein [uncultured Paludibaculum sp.]|uniref:prohead protease/major capsid protein fusion protein n=1 Tax=uncultured Paludibaculum sp. TaxID=1765020 RepID=UPI002AABBCCF|nr:prohead protease/major capsid protein fusion protein [uncultured Paludibaculum sp.]